MPAQRYPGPYLPMNPIAGRVAITPGVEFPYVIRELYAATAGTVTGTRVGQSGTETFSIGAGERVTCSLSFISSATATGLEGGY